MGQNKGWMVTILSGGNIAFLLKRRPRNHQPQDCHDKEECGEAAGEPDAEKAVILWRQFCVVLVCFAGEISHF